MVFVKTSIFQIVFTLETGFILLFFHLLDLDLHPPCGSGSYKNLVGMENMVCAGLDEDILSTGITLYQLREGDTIIGNAEADEIPHIILKGPRSESHPLICPLRIRIQIPAMLHLDPN